MIDKCVISINQLSSVNVSSGPNDPLYSFCLVIFKKMGLSSRSAGIFFGTYIGHSIYINNNDAYSNCSTY